MKALFWFHLPVKGLVVALAPVRPAAIVRQLQRLGSVGTDAILTVCPALKLSSGWQQPNLRVVVLGQEIESHRIVGAATAAISKRRMVVASETAQAMRRTIAGRPFPAPPSARMTPATPVPAEWPARFGDELYRFALSRVSDSDAAEELVQETFLSALAGLATFRAEASERTWLFVILRRKIIDHYRRQARGPHIGLDALGDGGGTPESDYFNPATGHWTDPQAPASWLRADAALEQQEIHEALRRCQERLSPQQGTVFAMRFVEELSAEEICQELGLSSANYWVIVHRAKLQLRRCLEKNGLGKN